MVDIPAATNRLRTVLLSPDSMAARTSGFSDINTLANGSFVSARSGSDWKLSPYIAPEVVAPVTIPKVPAAANSPVTSLSSNPKL